MNCWSKITRFANIVFCVLALHPAAYSESAQTAQEHLIPGRFSTSKWNEKLSDRQVDRVNDFVFLLQDYNLIGMQREQIISLLGPEDLDGSYTLRRGGYDVFAGLCFEYENDRVKRWRIRGAIDTLSNRQWISTNVLFRPNAGVNRFIPKCPRQNSSAAEEVPKPSLSGSTR